MRAKSASKFMELRYLYATHKDAHALKRELSHMLLQRRMLAASIPIGDFAVVDNVLLFALVSAGLIMRCSMISSRLPMENFLAPWEPEELVCQGNMGNFYGLRQEQALFSRLCDGSVSSRTPCLCVLTLFGASPKSPTPADCAENSDRWPSFHEGFWHFPDRFQ